MHFGLITSIILHAGLLAWALITIQSTPERRVVEPEPLAVEIVTASELTKLKQGARDAKQPDAQAADRPKTDVAKKEAPKPKVAAAPPPPAEPPPPPPEPKVEPPKPPEPAKSEPPPEPAKAESQPDPIAEKLAAAPPPPAPVPGPQPDEQKKLEEKILEDQRVAEAKKQADEAKRKADEAKRLAEAKAAEEKKKADEKKRQDEARRKELEKKRLAEQREKAEKQKQFDAEKISALLNKVPDKGGAPPPSPPTETQAKAKGPTLGAPEGRNREISASELAFIVSAIRQGVKPCWNVLGGGLDAQTAVVRMRVRFKSDGSIDGAPQVLNAQGGAYFQAAQESAVRAVLGCQPYRLPAEKYDIWKDVILNFDPRDMF
jgi:colicin import membrane protein